MLTEGDIAIRVHDSKGDLIEAALRKRFPNIHVTQAPLERAAKERLLVTFRPPDDEDLSNYTWVHSTGAGVDAICAALAPLKTPPPVTRTTGRMGQQIGEYCLAYGLAHLQKMAERRARQAERVWDRDQLAPDYCFEADVAVLGTGSIGSGVAQAFAALGAAVTGYSRSGRAAEGFVSVRPLQDFAGGHDIVVAALPLTAETRGLVGAPLLGRLQSALLINVGRGATVDEAALKAALEEGALAHAVLDVFAEEPLPEASWLWAHPQITVTPHVSGLTLPEDAVNRLSDLIDALLCGHRPQSEVDLSRGY